MSTLSVDFAPAHQAYPGNARMHLATLRIDPSRGLGSDIEAGPTPERTRFGRGRHGLDARVPERSQLSITDLARNFTPERSQLSIIGLG